MGKGNARVVTAPASKATAYGIEAAAKSAARVIGEVADEVVETIQEVGLQAAARQAPSPAWVVAARKIWVALAKTDPSLKSVVLADLTWFARYAGTLYGKPAVSELDTVGFAAWTASSKLVLVAEGLFDAGPDVAKVLLKHEAQHVQQFRDHGNRPPSSYLEMVRFEAKAYARSLAELTPLKGKSKTNASVWAAFEHLIECLEAASRLSPDAAVRQSMFDYVDVNGDRSPLLPPSADTEPSSLYVP